MGLSRTDDAALTAALAGCGCPEDLARACRAALETLEASGDVQDADRSFREFALAFAALAGISARASPPPLDVVVTTRTNRATATCTAPNCAGHRVRA
jgi:hypothetical protein